MKKALRNDCFALPPGIDWTPVPEALGRLRMSLDVVVAPQTVRSADATGRIVAQDIRAVAAHPPFTNAAVDGYAFDHAAISDTMPTRLPLVEGRSAAGHGYAKAVPPGAALRILTGAPLPATVDTVVLQEDVRIEAGHVVMDGTVRSGSNARTAGEDITPGQLLFATGHKIRPHDLSVLASGGVAEVLVHAPLKVGVMSTGDEVAERQDQRAGRIPDANRPMLLAMVRNWGFEAVDLGRAPDDARAVQDMLRNAVSRVDAILTTGGASAGDEDHMAAAIRTLGKLDTWRIAVKPGRPLAMGMIEGVPVFGLPGNPVAAFVCTLVFARPAFCLMAGQGWQDPMRLQLASAFSKRKKPGRMEYLRARMGETGSVEVFSSEGSGRVTGLSWANGLVELGDEAADIAPGDTITFLPFAGFGL